MKPTLPIIPGHEGAGVVVRLGARRFFFCFLTRNVCTVAQQVASVFFPIFFFRGEGFPLKVNHSQQDANFCPCPLGISVCPLVPVMRAICFLLWHLKFWLSRRCCLAIQCYLFPLPTRVSAFLAWDTLAQRMKQRDPKDSKGTLSPKPA